MAKPLVVKTFEQNSVTDMVHELNSRTGMKVQDFYPDDWETRRLNPGEMKAFLIGVNVGMYLAAEYVSKIQKGEVK